MMDLARQVSEARLALHRLMTGTAVVELEVDGQRTRFTPARRQDLEAYLARLEAGAGAIPARGAIAVIF
jgi:hypothetical protein